MVSYKNIYVKLTQVNMASSQAGYSDYDTTRHATPFSYYYNSSKPALSLCRSPLKLYSKLTFKKLFNSTTPAAGYNQAMTSTKIEAYYLGNITSWRHEGPS